MKKLLVTLMAVGIMGTSFQAPAAACGVVSIVEGSSRIALIGLGAAGGGIGLGLLSVKFISSSSVALGYAGLTFYGGLIILDGEHEQEIQFKTMSHADLLKMNLTNDEAVAFNNNTEELTQALKVVSSELTKKSKVEDAKKLWDEQESILGSDAINGARKVIAHALNK